MKTFIQKNKLLLGLVGIVLVVCLIVVFAGMMWGALSSFFGAGAARKLFRVVADEEVKRLADLEREKKAALIADVREKQALKERQMQEQGSDRADIKTQSTRAVTQQDLDAMVDREADALDRELSKESGFARLGILALICVMGWITIAMAAPTTRPTQAQVQRAERIALLLRRARTALRHQREKHALEISQLRSTHARELRERQIKLDSCRLQSTIRTTCPPCWRPALVTGLVVAGVCGGVIGIREVIR